MDHGGAVELLRPNVPGLARRCRRRSRWPGAAAPRRRRRAARRRWRRSPRRASTTSVGGGGDAVGGPVVAHDDRVGAPSRPAGTSITIGSTARPWCSQPRASACSGRSGKRAGGVVAAEDLGPAELAVLDRGGHGAGREAVEVELVDAAVPPHLLVGGRQRRRREPLGRRGAPVGQAGRAGAAGVGGERAQGTSLANQGPYRPPDAQATGGSALPKAAGATSACGRSASCPCRRPCPSCPSRPRPRRPPGRRSS